MTLSATIRRALEEGEPVRSPSWELKQWLGFLVYAALLIGLIVLAWRLARPDPERPPS
jgi:hypothetical protein